jgi:hypothetical protein
MAFGLSKGLAPISTVIDGLAIAAPLTGCGNVVDFQKLKAASDPSSFLKELGIGK